MQLAVVGTGYVGLVTAACFAEMGYRVACHDINSERVHALQRGEVPFFEPQLPELVLRGLATQRLSFTCDLKEVLTNVSACFLAVPTPSLPDGSCDLSYLLQASTQIAEQLETSCVVVIKSTAAIGTGQKIQQKICEILQRRGVSFSCDVVSNPEFLKET